MYNETIFSKDGEYNDGDFVLTSPIFNSYNKIMPSIHGGVDIGLKF
jgi:hypothetical protein